MRFLLAQETRERLHVLAEQHKATYAELSRILGRADGYMSRYFGEGVPYELAETDRRRLARYFGVDEGNLRQLPARRPKLTWARGRSRGA